MLWEIVISLVTTLVAVFLVFLVFKPRFKIKTSIDCARIDGDVVYNVGYTNTSFFSAYEISVKAWFRVMTQASPVRYSLIWVPVDDPEIPFLQGRPHATQQYPRLLFEEVDKDRVPDSAHDVSPAGLLNWIRDNEGSLSIAVTATHSSGQIRKTFVRTFDYDSLPGA